MNRTCPDCGAEFEPDSALGQQCPRCLFDAGAVTIGKSSSDDDEPETGRQIGPYRIVDRLGVGGMGIVYLAEQDEPIRRRVALKIIKLGMDSEQVIARFEGERQTLALMNHPNVAKVIDAGVTEEGRPYFVMEHVPGVPITQFCDDGRRDLRERLDLFRQTCDAIQHAHHKGIIHRDVKPSNVLVSVEDGQPRVKVIDFGVAKATTQRRAERTAFTQQGVLIGTPEYMSPEQADPGSLDVDTRTDVYSLGVMLYELVAGALPFDPTELRRAGFEEILRRIREDNPPRPSRRISTMGDGAGDAARKRRTDPGTLSRKLRGELDWIVMRALEKEPARRYDSPNDLASDIGRFLDHRPVLARPASLTYRLAKQIRRHRVGFTIGGVAFLLVAALGIWGGMGRWQAARRADLAQRFGLEVGNVEWQLRVAQMSPRHDLSPETERVENLLVSIRDSMDELGRAASAPGHYALGRGRLALGEIEGALPHLDAAWEQGLQTADVAFARGVVLGRLYSREAGRAGRILDPERKEAAMAAARERYLAPALGALGEARSTPSAPLGYVEALIAFYEGRHDEALQLAEKVSQEAAWFWEAHALRGLVYNQLLPIAFRENRPEEGNALMDSIDEAFSAVLEVAPSAPEGYRGLCAGRVFRVHRAFFGRADDEGFTEIHERALSVCREGLVVARDPDLVRALSDLHRLNGRRIMKAGGDPMVELEAARVKAEEAIEGLTIYPEGTEFGRRANAMRSLGDAYLELGEWTARTGEDPRDYLDRSAEGFDRSLEFEPDSAAAANNAGIACRLKAKYEADEGIDPTASLERAEQYYALAAELFPSAASVKENVVNVMKDRASWESAHGTDPRERLREAAELMEKLVELAPEYPHRQTNMADLAILLAQTERDWGGEPSPWLERGRTALAVARELAPGQRLVVLLGLRFDMDTLRERVARDEDPTTAATAARDAIDRCLQLEGERPVCLLYRASLERDLARYSMGHGGDPDPHLRSGLESLEEAQAVVGPEHPGALGVKADLYLLSAESRAPGPAARESLFHALEAARMLAEIASGDADSLVTVARVHLWQARLASTDDERAAALGESQLALERALEINPSLRSRVEDEFAELDPA